ncbi:hypothetical protein MMC10_001420 [Thelotrema lepadinum]|nr:hypothetical protein [Thelotrema lepadinum]
MPSKKPAPKAQPLSLPSKSKSKSKPSPSPSSHSHSYTNSHSPSPSQSTPSPPSLSPDATGSSSLHYPHSPRSTHSPYPPALDAFAKPAIDTMSMQGQEPKAIARFLVSEGYKILEERGVEEKVRAYIALKMRKRK